MVDFDLNFTRSLIANTFGVKSSDVTDAMFGYVNNFSETYYNDRSIAQVKNWDEYYYTVAKAVASNSKCLSRRIGSILVQDKSIVGTGYNGPPRGVVECSKRHQLDISLWAKYKQIDSYFDREVVVSKCPRQIMGFKSGEGLAWCVAGHSERNCLINSARNGISTKGGIMYLTCGVPCSPCLVEIINAGIVEIVVTSFDLYDESAKFLIENSNLKVRMYKF